MSIFRTLLGCVPCLTTVREVDNEEQQPLFPPPDTILTPPRRRHPLPHQCSEHSLSEHSVTSHPSRPGHPRGYGSAGTLSETSRERIGSISRAYQGHMVPLNKPSRPTSANSSTTTTPHASHLTFNLPPTRRPHRAGAPALGRSISEPRSLTLMATHPGDTFSPHQIPVASPTSPRSGSLSPVIVHRGRPRSATHIGRLSPLHSREPSSDQESRVVRLGLMEVRRPISRGRSPGPAAVMNRSISTGDVTGLVEAATMSEPPQTAEEGRGQAIVDEPVVRMDLGLRDLQGLGGRTRRGRGSSHSRGRTTRRVTG